MNVVLVVGCALGGTAVGGFLGTLTARINSVHVSVAEPETEKVGALVGGATRGEHRVVPPSAVPRSPSAVELALGALLTGVTFALLAWRLGAVAALVGYCTLLAGLIAVSIVDARLGIVPRVILYPTFVLSAIGLVGASAVDHHWGALFNGAIGGVAAFAAFFALWWFFPRGMGYGDVRLAGVIGAALGWIGLGEIYVGFLAAFVVGTAVGLVLMTKRGTGRKTRFAFGPSLSVGAAFGILWGPWAVHLWLHHG